MDGAVLRDFACNLSYDGNSKVISWKAIPGYQYKVQWSDTLADGDFRDITPFQAYPTDEGSVVDDTPPATARFYRVVRIPNP